MPFILFNFADFSHICGEKNAKYDKSELLIDIKKMQISYNIAYFQK